MKRIANYLGFQAGWLACIVAAAAGAPWLGVSAVAAIAAANLVASKNRRQLAWLLGAAAAIGYAADSALALGGLLDFPPQATFGAPSPLWMVALWVNFAATIGPEGALDWLSGRRWAQTALGALGGPLAYWAGAQLGAVELAALPVSLIAIAAEWAAATPFLFWISRHAERWPAAPQKEPTG